MVHPLESREDEALLSLIQEGSHAAFDTLVRRHAERFYRLAYRFMANRAEAEDIVQDIFLKLWERPGIWQENRKARFTTWFYRVTVNACLDRRRKQRDASLPDGLDVADDRHSTEDMMLKAEAGRRLEQAIRTLPERQQVALNLCFYEGISNQEAAEVMGVPLKALQSLLMRGKTTLKAQLAHEKQEPHYGT